MKATKATMRNAARAALERHCDSVRSASGRGVTVGARLEAIMNGEIRPVAVRTSHDRLVGFTRNSEGDWRTLPNVEIVLVAVPRDDGSTEIEVLAFQRDRLIDYFDRAKNSMLKREQLPANEIPIFVPLDDRARKDVGHTVAGLKKEADWSVTFSKDELAKLGDSGDDENFIERVRREFAAINNVDVSKVKIEFRIID